MQGLAEIFEDVREKKIKAVRASAEMNDEDVKVCR